MERIKRWIAELSRHQWLEQRELRSWEIRRANYVLPGQYEEETAYTEGEGLDVFPSVQGTTYFFRTRLEIPESWRDAPFGLVFESGGEGLLRVNGRSYQGLDRNHTYVTLDASRIGDRPELEIELFDPVPEPVDPLNHQAVIQPPITSVTSLLVRPNEAVRSLMYTVTIVRDSAALMPEAELRRVRLLEALHQGMDAFVGMTKQEIEQGEGIRAIEQQLRTNVRGIGGNAEGLEHMIGQSHIDIAWLWPVRETVRKTSRTFSTVDALMNEYPDYMYTQSQPLLYAFLKENDPELYERVKARIADGRWELVGGMWVEPDLNIPSGESLMRQMLYGQRFYQEEFGKTSRIEWLPDTFGYCASLPQILKHGGVDYFMTTKLGWNDTNMFPHDLFHWVGIDGTAILSYLNHGVNEHTLPKDIHDHWQSYRQKAEHPEQMLLYGHGDGGGGVTREMLEYVQRTELMVGQPSQRYSTAAAFFAEIEQRGPELPAWHGDLYLELHRGTYTTHARNKRHNRRAENLYREAELWHVLARPELDEQSDTSLRSSLHDGWKLILLNQFHDIIPGSAITESYVTSEQEYVRVKELGEQGLAQGLHCLAAGMDVNRPGDGVPYAVFNGFGWKRSPVVKLPGTDSHDIDVQAKTKVYVVTDGAGQELPMDVGEDGISVRVEDIPAFGYRVIWLTTCDVQAHYGTDGQRDAGTVNGMNQDALAESDSRQQPMAELAASMETHAEPREDNSQQVIDPSPGCSEFVDTWETPFYQVRFNANGEIIRLWDKTAKRNVLKPGEGGNRFYFFHDRPLLWDAWDIDSHYEHQVAGEAELLEQKWVLAGRTKDVLRFRWRLHDSFITQDIVFYHHDRRIDFKTQVNWKEEHKLLKVGFPIDVVTSKATYEIPFGALERPTHRNTSWEQAQYEVCGHRFVDVSEYGYGVSLLNDCKYGYDVQGCTIRLSLLRAPRWPDRTADLGEHHFTYALYPHEGDWRSAHTVRRASELNSEAAVMRIEGEDKDGAVNTALSPSSDRDAWIRLDSKHVILDTVKTAEDGNGTVLRFYESAGSRERIVLRWPHAFGQAYLSNALEVVGEPLEANDRQIELQFAPYEIKTVLLRDI